MKNKEKKTPPLFDLINLINLKGEYPSEDFIDNNYNQYICNRAFSLYQDTIFIAEKMNELWNTPKNASFALYYYGVEKRKRFSKWHKKDDSEENKINIIKEYYGYSTLKARELIPILDDLNIWEDIEKDLNKGGIGKKCKKKKE